MSTYDPVSTATALAENYVYARQTQLDTASSKAQTQTSALTSLKSALTTFTSALSNVTSKGSVIAQTATVSNTSAASASVSATASAGSYSFEVEQLATGQQSLYSVESLGLTQKDAGTEEWPPQPKVVVSLGDGGFFSVDLANADVDGDGKLSASEVARAINSSSQGKVSAAVMTQNGQQQLLINAGALGKEGAFQLHVLGSTASEEAVASYVASLGASSVAASAVAPVREVSQAQDAKIWIGSKPISGLEEDGVLIQQSSNTYSGITGLSVEFKEASATPVTVAVAKDESKTKSNMESFVSAYNTLIKAIDKLTATGNADSGVSAGALSGDSGIRSLRNKLNSLLRSNVGGVSLTEFGISAQRDGTIALDGDRFAKKVAANPDALTQLLGATDSLEYKRSGVLGSLQTYVNSWTSSTGGLLQSRQDSIAKQRAQFDKQQSTIDRMYEQAYQRYLTQFSALASLEDQMSSTKSMLTSMFSSDDS